MPKSTRGRRQADQGKPQLKQIAEPIITPGVEEFIRVGKALSGGPPGTLVLLVGSGFGKDPDAASVRFGEYPTAPMPGPLYTDGFMLATVPLVPPGDVRVSVSVGNAASNALAFRVARRPVPGKPPGTTTLKVLTSLDALAVLVAAEIRIADFRRFANKTFQNQLAEEAFQARIGLLAIRERFNSAERMGADLIDISEIKDEQVRQLIMRMGQKVSNRLKALFDEIFESSRALEQLDLAMARIRQGGTTTATKTLEIVAEGANLVADLAGAAESASQSLSLSAEAGIAIASGDVITNPATAVAAGVYGVAKAIANSAKIGALLSRNADADRQDQEELEYRKRTELKLDRAEGKLDKAESKMELIESKQDRTEAKLDRSEQKLDKNEMKNDKIEVKLDRVEEKLDRGEIKNDRIEAKLDRVEPKLDYVESKLDRQEAKLEKLEGKADKAEGKLDRVSGQIIRLEGKADKAEGKLDKLEGKADRAEGKLDKLEGKADKAEGKLDKSEAKLEKLEGKADKAETKLDKLEKKSDKAEMKLDKLEEKADKTEVKLEKLEGKIDKEEIKLDILQGKADRNKEFWQFSPEDWKVEQATTVGVRVQGAFPLPGPTGPAFSVESIHVLAEGFQVYRLVVDGVVTNVEARLPITPCNVLVSLGLGLIGASVSVAIEFDRPYTGPIEFNGEKPQAMRLCTFVRGENARQDSPNPCEG